MVHDLHSQLNSDKSTCNSGSKKSLLAIRLSKEHISYHILWLHEGVFTLITFGLERTTTTIKEFWLQNFPVALIKEQKNF